MSKAEGQPVPRLQEDNTITAMTNTSTWNNFVLFEAFINILHIYTAQTKDFALYFSKIGKGIKRLKRFVCLNANN